MSVTRVELSQAFREAIMTEFADVPSEEQISLTFSEEFEQKMKKLIERQKKSYWKYVNTVAKRVAVVALLVLSVAMMVLSNEEVRASMLQWCKDVYEEYIYYYFEGDTTKVIEYEYQLMGIPEGVEKVYEYRDSEIVTISYENQAGDYIDFRQQVTEDFDIYVDNEKGKWSTVIINNKDVKLFDYTTLMGAMWIEDGYYMLLIYHGCDDIEIIKEMVETVR